MGDNQLSQHLTSQSSSIFQVLEAEFINLKYKAARCGKNCFVGKGFSEALACEKKCMNSIRNVLEVMKAQQKMIDLKLNACIEEIKIGNEGGNSKIAEAFEGPVYCYKIYSNDLENLKGEMLREFSYYT